MGVAERHPKPCEKEKLALCGFRTLWSSTNLSGVLTSPHPWSRAKTPRNRLITSYISELLVFFHRALQSLSPLTSFFFKHPLSYINLQSCFFLFVLSILFSLLCFFSLTFFLSFKMLFIIHTWSFTANCRNLIFSTGSLSPIFLRFLMHSVWRTAFRIIKECFGC